MINRCGRSCRTPPYPNHPRYRPPQDPSRCPRSSRPWWRTKCITTHPDSDDLTTIRAIIEVDFLPPTSSAPLWPFMAAIARGILSEWLLAGWLMVGWLVKRKNNWSGITDASSWPRFESIVKTYRKRVDCGSFCSFVWW